MPATDLSILGPHPVDAQDPDRVYALSGETLRSDDGGAHWVALGAAPSFNRCAPSTFGGVLALDARSRALYAVTPAGIYRLAKPED
jgi:hypothetical protein